MDGAGSGARGTDSAEEHAERQRLVGWGADRMPPAIFLMVPLD